MYHQRPRLLTPPFTAALALLRLWHIDGKAASPCGVQLVPLRNAVLQQLVAAARYLLKQLLMDVEPVLAVVWPVGHCIHGLVRL
jgi:hypothetical protein